MPTRKQGDEIALTLKQERDIENNLLLHQAIDALRDIKAAQDLNHAVTVQLRDHNTIEKADKIWQTILRARWLLTVIGALLTGLGAILGALYVTHAIWRWPA